MLLVSGEDFYCEEIFDVEGSSKSCRRTHYGRLTLDGVWKCKCSKKG